MNNSYSKNILIVRVGAIGDVLMATPLVSAIRKEFPDSYLGFLTSRYAIPLLQYNHEINALYSIKHRNLPFWLSIEKQRIVNEMRTKKWDIIFLLESNPVFASLIKKFNAKAVYGFNPPPPPFIKGENGGFEGITFSPDSHVISNFLKLGSLLGKSLNDAPMKVYWNDAATEKMKTILSKLPDKHPKIAIHAGFGPSGKKGRKAIGVKGWPLDRFRETIIRLNKETGASFVITGTAEEFTTNKSIIKGLRFPLLNLAGRTTIPELGALLNEMDMLISIDSSPAHIAAAVGMPLIVLWGPAIETKMRPVSLNSPVVIINKHLPCSPCYETPRKDSCSNNICMKEIQVDEVVEEALKLLNRHQSTRHLSPVF